MSGLLIRGKFGQDFTDTKKSQQMLLVPLTITPGYFNERREGSGRVGEGVTTKINKWRCRM